MADDISDLPVPDISDLPAPLSAAGTPETTWQKVNNALGVTRGLGLTGRALAKGVGALPLFAMDLGVGARNAITGSNYTMPSAMFDKGLNDIGLPQPQTALEKGVGLAETIGTGAGMPGPTAVGGAFTAAPAAFKALPAGKIGAAQSANGAGLVVPPSSANPTLLNRILGGLSGKLQTQQQASMMNQPRINQLIAKGLGQNPEAPLSIGALGVIRQEAAIGGYAPVRQFGAMKSDQQFADKLDSLTSASKGAEKSFPGLTKGNSQLEETLATLKQPSFDSADAVDAISHLRGLADDAYSAGNSTFGRAYKGAASALEDLVERNLSAAGKGGQELLQRFRDARAQIAKTYSVQKALNNETGDVSAPALARQLALGKPLSGELKQVGSFARAFPKAAATPKESYEPISPLDMYGSAIAAGTTGSVSPLLLPISRVGLRNFLLSPKGQAMALSQPTNPAFRMGLAGTIPGLSGLMGP